MIRTVTDILCDRCERPIPGAAPAPDAPAALSFDCLGESIRYAHLCPRCEGVCRDYLRRIAGEDPLRHRAPKAAPAPEPTPAAPKGKRS